MLILTGAYGRRYETLEQAMEDWVKGLDFKVAPNGPYTSIRDLYELHARGYNVVLAAGAKNNLLQVLKPEVTDHDRQCI